MLEYPSVRWVSKCASDWVPKYPSALSTLMPKSLSKCPSGSSMQVPERLLSALSVSLECPSSGLRVPFEYPLSALPVTSSTLRVKKVQNFWKLTHPYFNRLFKKLFRIHNLHNTASLEITYVILTKFCKPDIINQKDFIDILKHFVNFQKIKYDELQCSLLSKIVVLHS